MLRKGLCQTLLLSINAKKIKFKCLSDYETSTFLIILDLWRSLQATIENYISTDQFAFGQKHVKVNQIHIVWRHIRGSLECGKYCFLVYLDVQQVFENDKRNRTSQRTEPTRLSSKTTATHHAPRVIRLTTTLLQIPNSLSIQYYLYVR